jgi:hypothetical protein
MIQCAQSECKPSTCKGSLEFQSGALRSILNLKILIFVIPLLLQPSESVDSIYDSSMTTPGTHPYGCSQIRQPRLAPQLTSHLKPEYTHRHTSSSDSRCILAGENTTITPTDLSSQSTVLHMNHHLHTPTIRMEFQNE